MQKVLKILIMQDQPNVSLFFNVETARFRKRFPGLDLDIDLVPWHLGAGRIIGHIKDKSGPDIVQVGSTWIGSLNHLNGFTDLSGQFGEMVAREFPPVAQTMVRIAGSNMLSAIPWFLDLRGLMYNKPTLKKAGIDPGRLATHTGFRDACESLNPKGHTLESMRQIGILIFHDLSPWIWNFGGDFFSEDGLDTVFDSARSIEGMDFYFSLVNEFEGLMTGQIDVNRINRFLFANEHALFNSGLGPVFMFMNRDSIGYNVEVSARTGIANQPAGPAAGYAFTGGSCLAVMDYSPNKDMAGELLHFLMEKESQCNLSLWTGYAPCNKEAFLTMLDGLDEGTEVLKTALKHAHPFPNHFLWPTMESLISDFCQEMMGAVNIGTYSSSLLKNTAEKVCGQMRYILRQKRGT